MDSATKSIARTATAPAAIYLSVTLAAFIIIAVVFVFFPRSRYSELEKRELAQAPDFSFEALFSGKYTADVSHWFNDTEPFRDELMELSMNMRNAMRLVVGGDEAITFVAAETSEEELVAQAEEVPADSIAGDEDVPAVDEGVSKISHNGIVVVGTGDNVRALAAYGGVGGGNAFSAAVNHYAEVMPGIRMYVLVAPIASEFYMPEKAKSRSKSQLATIENIRDLTAGSATFVDAYSALKAHVDEDIYLRTDHHWAPLGAYYAAEKLAAAANVPFRTLEQGYDRQVVHGFVGTMYAYSQNISVKNAPEDFVYYVPNAVDYSTTFRVYRTNSDFKVIGEGAPFKSSFFKKFKDGSGGAYSTFMGSDQLLTVVKTGTANGRRLLIIKDSYGNAIPGYMFYSFEEVHVVDFRYFTRNLPNYCATNGITDLAFVFNIFNSYSASTGKRLERFLSQHDGSYAAPTPARSETPMAPAEEETASDNSEAAPEAVEEPSPAPAAADEPEVNPAPEPVTSPEPVTDPEPTPEPAIIQEP